MDEVDREIKSFLEGKECKDGQDNSLTARFLSHYLRRYFARREDREDAISTVRLRILPRAGELKFPNRAAWFAYVARAAAHCAIDTLRKCDEGLMDNPDEIPAEDYPYVELVACLIEDADLVHRLADELWLEVDPRLSEGERKRRLFAAQLFYLNGLSWDQICQILSANGTVTRETLDEWLGNRSLLLCLAYAKLYRDNERLTGTIVDPKNPPSSRELDQLTELARSRTSTPPDGWSWPEIEIVMLRYRNGLCDRKILQMCPWADAKTLAKVVKMAEPRMPFATNAQSLVAGVQKRRIPGQPLKTPGPWRRMAFQYGAVDSLPYDHILERMNPATRAADVRFTKGMLTVGLAGRYLSELIAYAQERYSCYKDKK